MLKPHGCRSIAVVTFCWLLVAVANTPAQSTDWPQWRGPNRDGKSDEKGLLKSWPKSGPKLLWTFDQAGLGYSGPAIVGDDLFILSEIDEKETLIALDASTGKTKWAKTFGGHYENNWGDGPRSTPTVDGDFVYVLGASGELACIKRDSGDIVWSKNLVNDFGGTIEAWGYSESPLVDGDFVVVCPGQSKFLVKLNKTTGETYYTSTGFNDPPQYSSVVKAKINNTELYFTMCKKGLVAFDALSGKFLFNYEATKNGVAVIPTPIIAGDYVYSTSDYGTGCGLIKITGKGDKINFNEVYFSKEMQNHHGGVVLVNKHIYGYSGNNPSGKESGWMCQDLMTGEVKWRKGGRKQELGKGSLTYADGHLYCYGEADGRCLLVEATPKDWKVKGSLSIPEKTKSPRKAGAIWTHPVIANGRLYLRDQEYLFAFDIRGKK